MNNLIILKLLLEDQKFIKIEIFMIYCLEKPSCYHIMIKIDFEQTQFKFGYMSDY